MYDWKEVFEQRNCLFDIKVYFFFKKYVSFLKSIFLFDIKVHILGYTFSKSFIIKTFEVVKPTSVLKNMNTKIIVITVAAII